MDDPPSPGSRRSSDLRPFEEEGLFGLRVVGAVKFGSGLLLAAAAFGIFRLVNHGFGTNFEYYASRLHLDPENRLVHEILARVAGLTHAQLRALGVGTFFYAGLHLVEGSGLLLKRLWAGYLTVIASGTLLPLEVYEIARKSTPQRFLVLAVNVAIVVYLVIKLRREHARLRAAAE